MWTKEENTYTYSGKAPSFGWMISNGYLPYWHWKFLRFEWEPSQELLKIWIDNGEIG